MTKHLDQSETESDRELFLSLPQDVVEELAEDRILPILAKSFRINLLVYSPTKQTTVQWMHPNTVSTANTNEIRRANRPEKHAKSDVNF